MSTTEGRNAQKGLLYKMGHLFLLNKDLRTTQRTKREKELYRTSFGKKQLQFCIFLINFSATSN